MASLEMPWDDKDDETCPSLTLTQRVIGCGVCIGLSAILNIIAWVMVFQEDWTTFAILFSLANVATVASSFFLSGPKSQAKKVMSDKRWIFAGLWFIMLIFTFVAALAIKEAWLVLCSAVVQYVFLVIYLISIYPMGVTFLRNTCCPCI